MIDTFAEFDVDGHRVEVLADPTWDESDEVARFLDGQGVSPFRFIILIPHRFAATLEEDGRKGLFVTTMTIVTRTLL